MSEKRERMLFSPKMICLFIYSPSDDLVSDDLVRRRRLPILPLVQVPAQVERHVLGVREAGVVVHAL